ncbi:MAG: SDR family NAD(P)-dependent oxidoreductase [Candidatus Izemoplasmatales bacterium]|jgi:short-subunit dehydrogenase
MSKTVVISGASSGIGFATARILQKSGYHVIGLSRSYPKETYDFNYILCDITDEVQIKNAVDKILSTNPDIYALINCAGMGISGAIEYTEAADIKTIFDVNLLGTFQLTKILIPALRKVPNSKIINIGSVAGCLTIPFQAYYSITKAGINAYTEALRMELRPFGIHVGAVLPGDTKTNFTANRQKANMKMDNVYGNRIQLSIERMEKDEQNGKSADTVGITIRRLLSRKTVPVYKTVGFSYKLFIFLKRLLPSRFVNWILYQMYAK